MYLCKYKDIFGKVGKGIHSFRICNIAVVDVVLTMLLAYCIHLMLPNYSFSVILLLLFLLSIVVHRLFCVRTTIDKLLFG